MLALDTTKVFQVIWTFLPLWDPAGNLSRLDSVQLFLPVEVLRQFDLNLFPVAPHTSVLARHVVGTLPREVPVLSPN